MLLQKQLKSKILDILKETRTFSFLKSLWIFNFKSIGFEHIAENIFRDLEKVNSFEEIVQVLENNFDNKDLKKFKRKNYKIGKLNEFTYSLIRPYLENSKAYLDYGCGKMALIRRIVKENHTNLINIYGFDPHVKIEYLPQDNKVKFFNKANKFKTVQKLDLISVNFVLHHLNQEEIIHTLSLLKSKLSKNGKILILEESFPENSPKCLHNQNFNKL